MATFRFFSQNRYQESSRYVIRRIVQIKKNDKVKKTEGAALKTPQEYGALGINANIAAIQQMVPLVDSATSFL